VTIRTEEDRATDDPTGLLILERIARRVGVGASSSSHESSPADGKSLRTNADRDVYAPERAASDRNTSSLSSPSGGPLVTGGGVLEHRVSARECRMGESPAAQRSEQPGTQRPPGASSFRRGSGREGVPEGDRP